MGAAATTIQTRQRLTVRLAEARARTDELFALARPEALYDRPIPERHRIIFYLGHFEAFDWNLLGRDLFGLESFHPQFDRLFAFGIDPVDGARSSDQPQDWPARAEVERYNQRLRQTLDAALALASLDNPKQPLLENGFLLQVAIEHRLMHAETLAYMLHHLPPDRKFGRLIVPASAAPPVAPRMVEIPAGTATLGLPRRAKPPFGWAFGWDPFGWDNEFEEHCVEVPAFEIDAYNVSNGDFLRFVRVGGYQRRELWNDAAWQWKESRGLEYPYFWTRRGEQWFYRTMFGEVPLPLDWPVYVSHAEAEAYSRWLRKSLPSEAEFHRAAYATRDGSERRYPWGHELPERRHGNFDFRQWDPAPVGSHPAGNSAFGAADLLGNGWEWTSTVFGPFPGFQPFPFYPGYSTDFFDGKHYVVKGGASGTAVCLLRRTFRNWYQPHYPCVYATFRCVAR